jgi:hypothetical protein
VPNAQPTRAAASNLVELAAVPSSRARYAARLVTRAVPLNAVAVIHAAD